LSVAVYKTTTELHINSVNYEHSSPFIELPLSRDTSRDHHVPHTQWVTLCFA